MKKILALLMICSLILVTGCGGGDKPADKPAAEKSAEQPVEMPEVKLGMITHLNATEKKMEDLLQKMQGNSSDKITHYVPVYYDNLKLMQMGIESGNVDEISLYKSVADYVIANNDKFELVSDMPLKNLPDDFCFAVRKDDANIKADLDKTIKEMNSDGSLDKLVETYISKVDKGQAPPVVKIPMTDGAQTIKVGVTGDLPPLDYVSADGQAAGFNTALLAEVAKRSGKNIEIVNIDSGARAAALASGQIDVIFWVVVPSSNKMPKDIDSPEKVEISAPYFKDDVEHVKLKDNK